MEHSVFLEAKNFLCGTGVIDKSVLMRWLNTRDLESQGVLSGILSRPDVLARVQPALSYEEIHLYYLQYFKRCLIEDPASEWADSRYQAAHSLVSIFTSLWQNQGECAKYLKDFKTLLEELIFLDDDDISTAVVVGVMEHLFCVKGMAKFFKEWLTHPKLKIAYMDALMFSKGFKET